MIDDPESVQPLLKPSAKKSVGKAKGYFSKVKVIVGYLADDLRKQSIQFKIAIFSIFITVTFISVLMNASDLMMVMFVGMSEQSFSDSDLYVSTINSNTNTAVGQPQGFTAQVQSNLVDINDTMRKVLSVNEVSGAAPRWLLPGFLLNPYNSSKNTTVICFLGDSKTENKYGVGRALKLPPLGPNEAYIMNSGLNAIELKDNNFTFRLDVLRYMRELGVLTTGKGSEEASDKEVIRRLVTSQLGNRLVIYPPDGKEIWATLNVPSNIPNPIENVTFPAINLTLPALVDAITDVFYGIITTDMNYTYISNFSKNLGKWPETRGNGVFLEREAFVSKIIASSLEGLKNISRILASNITQTLSAISGFESVIQGIIQSQIESLVTTPMMSAFNRIDVNNSAMTVSVIARDKMDIYSSFIQFQDKLIEFSNKVSAALGDPEKYTMLSLMYFGFQGLGFVSIFIRNIIYMILVLLGILSVVLLASLMVFGIDERTYEFGMLRALGLERSGLVLLLTLQGIVFAVSGWCLGLLVSWVITIALQVKFYLDIRYLQGINYSTAAWLIGVLFGLLLPVLVSMYSIRSALTERLRDALDLYHRSVNTLKVMVVKLEKLGISQTVFVIGIELTLFGFIFYLLVPYFFFYNRFDLFIFTFNSILLLTLISLTVMANILQPLLERIFSIFCKFVMFKQRPLSSVIEKNLEAHQTSNRKTSLMLALCVCFIIFAGSGIHTQVSSIVSQIVIFNGADLSIETDRRMKALNEVALREYCDRPEVAQHIVSYTFISRHLLSYPGANDQTLSPRSFFPTFPAFISGIDQNFTKTFYEKYYTPRSYKTGVQYQNLPNGLKDGISPIFDGIKGFESVPADPAKIYANLTGSPSGRTAKAITAKAVLPSAIMDFTAIDVDTPALLQIKFNGETIIVNMDIASTADKIPGFDFSKYLLSALSASDILIPMQTYAQIVDLFKNLTLASGQEAYNQFITWETDEVKASSYGLLKNRMLIRLKEDTTEVQRDILKNGLKNVLKTDDSLTDSIDLQNTTVKALDYLKFLNVMIATLTCLISFFMLLISLMKKIKDNIWELGVLRSMGITIKQVFLIYSVETAAVIVSALVLGTSVGLIVSYVGSYFYFIFFEVNLGIGFPWTEFIFLVVFLALTTISTSYIGLRSFIYQPITKLIRGLV